MYFLMQRVGTSVRPGVCKPRSTTTKKDKGADCTACPDCVHCATIGGEATVKRGYARQPASSTADELLDSGKQSDSKLARQISIFKCQDTGACVGSNASLTRAAAPEQECKEGVGGVPRWARVILGGKCRRCAIHGPSRLQGSETLLARGPKKSDTHGRALVPAFLSFAGNMQQLSTRLLPKREGRF